MKILHLETALEWRGGQQQIAYLVKGLEQAGIQTVLVCPRASKIYAYFKEHHLPLYPLEVGHIWDFSAARKIGHFMQENRFSILHAHSSHALSLGLLIKFFHPNIRLVASRRVDFSVKKPIIGSLKYKNRLIDRVICISENIARVMQRDGVPRSKLSVIHSGIDLNRFSRADKKRVKNELGIPSAHFVVGTVAALVGHKDYPTLLRAAEYVLRNKPAVTFVAVGDGGDREKLEALHRSLKLGDRFRFVGFRSDVQTYLSLFDVFVLASQKEGLGTSVLDALAYGLPVVATRAGGIPEMIVHEQNGLLVPVGSAERLAKAIERLINDGALRKRLAARARKSVQNFSFEKMVEKHIALYRALLQET